MALYVMMSTLSESGRKVLRERPGWILEFYPPVRAGGAPEAEVLARIAATLEPEIRRHPEQWYPFHEVYDDPPRAS